MSAATDRLMHSGGVQLRPYTLADEADFVSLVTDEALMAALSGAMSPARARERHRLHCRFGEERTFAWAVTDSADRRYLGHLFLVWQAEPAAWELGYVIKAGAQGRGVATQAASAVLQWARQAGKQPLMITVDCDHIASQRVAEKIGLFGPEIRHDEQGPYYCYLDSGAPDNSAADTVAPPSGSRATGGQPLSQQNS